MSGLPDAASEENATAPPMIDGRVAAALDCAAPAAASDSAASDSAATPTTVASARVVEHLIILDFEGTCDPSDERLTRLQQCDIHEIIEFPAVWISARGENAGTEIDFFREYVKPVEGAAEGKAREISAFCTRLTGITQADVDSASTLDAVLERFRLWLDERGLVSALEAGTAVFVAHGGWDLVDQLPKECARKGLTLPSFYGTFADLKVLFALSCPEHRGTSLKQMLDLLGLPQFGRQHSGLDDCRNFARILSRLLALHADVSPTHQIGVGQLRGHGAGRRPGDWDCSACGAIAFASRPNCYRCGEPRVDPPERASPSETRQATAASSPRERSTRRSGDWDCPSCKAHVFSSKAVCFRCLLPRPLNADSPTPSSGSGGGHGGGRQPARRTGDWDCPNQSCRALVFASRQSCFRCGSPPPMHVQYVAAAAAWNSAQMGSMVPIGHGPMHADQMVMANSSMGPTAHQGYLPSHHPSHQGYLPHTQHGYAMNPTQPYAMAPQQIFAMGQAMSGGHSPQGNFHDAMVRSAHEQHQWAQQQAYMAQMAKMAGYTQ